MSTLETIKAQLTKKYKFLVIKIRKGEKGDVLSINHPSKYSMRIYDGEPLQYEYSLHIPMRMASRLFKKHPEPEVFTVKLVEELESKIEEQVSLFANNKYTMPKNWKGRRR